MRAAAVIALLLGACAGPPAEPELTGTWKRSHPDKLTGDELVLADDGSFTWTSFLRGELGQVSGTYGLDPELLVLHGAWPSGRAFTLVASYTHDDTMLALGAFVPTGEDDPAYRARWEWVDSKQPVYSWTIAPEVWMYEGSYAVAWVDPIWRRDKSEGGDYAETAEAFVLDEQFTFDRIGGGFVRDDGWDAGLQHDALWWDLGLVFTRER